MANSSATSPPDRSDDLTASSTAATKTEIATASSGGQVRVDQPASGASIVARYYSRESNIVGVDMMDLRDLKSDQNEDFWQFSIGGFLCSGSFWLGIERIVTIQAWEKDALFLMCAAAFFAGLILAGFGFRRLKRRQSRIDHIIRTAKPLSPTRSDQT